jgi:hypothetical protein
MRDAPASAGMQIPTGYGETPPKPLRGEGGGCGINTTSYSGGST